MKTKLKAPMKLEIGKRSYHVYCKCSRESFLDDLAKAEGSGFLTLPALGTCPICKYVYWVPSPRTAKIISHTKKQVQTSFI